MSKSTAGQKTFFMPNGHVDERYTKPLSVEEILADRLKFQRPPVTELVNNWRNSLGRYMLIPYEPLKPTLNLSSVEGYDPKYVLFFQPGGALFSGYNLNQLPQFLAYSLQMVFDQEHLDTRDIFFMAVDENWVLSPELTNTVFAGLRSTEPVKMTSAESFVWSVREVGDYEEIYGR